MIHEILMRLTRRAPARAIDLKSEDGSMQHYIERYHLAHFTLPLLGPVTVYLHRYLGSDGDRWLHDHPWDWSVGIPLVGGYSEERMVRLDPNVGIRSRMRDIFRFRPNVIIGRTFHRIAYVTRGSWTLFVHGPRTASWGFLERIPSGQHSGRVGYWVVYRQANDALDTSESTADWQKTAPPGHRFRFQRGTA